MAGANRYLKHAAIAIAIGAAYWVYFTKVAQS